MDRSAGYRTKQSEAVLSYISSLESTHVTAAQIAEHFAQEGAPIGRATIYRHLDKLTERGMLRKYTTDGVSGACYQQADPQEECLTHLHLKCESCGALLHLDCDVFDDIQLHVLHHHAFQVNAFKTVLYGTCGNCIVNKEA